MFFFKTSNGMWMPCGPKQSGAVQISMQELAAKGLAEQVYGPQESYELQCSNFLSGASLLEIGSSLDYTS